MARPTPPPDLTRYRRVAWDSYGRATGRVSRGHRAWQEGHIWHTLCGNHSRYADVVVDDWPTCAICETRWRKILLVLSMTHVMVSLRKLLYDESRF